MQWVRASRRINSKNEQYIAIWYMWKIEIDVGRNCISRKHKYPCPFQSSSTPFRIELFVINTMRLNVDDPNLGLKSRQVSSIVSDCGRES